MHPLRHKVYAVLAVSSALVLSLAAALVTAAGAVGTGGPSPAFAPVAAAATVVAPPAVVADANWILSAQLPDGAIPNYPGDDHLSPDMANQAAEGLARAAAVTGDEAYASAAWRWLGWYQAHEGPQGFVTDYLLSGGRFVTTGDMDSTDAYAGTFLSAAGAAWSADPDQSLLLALEPGIVGAVGAIEATQDTDGLTWAKPTWHVKYLMDQAETYGGLRSVAPLAAALGDAGLASRAAADAARMAAGVASLWSPSEGAFSWAVYNDGVDQSVDWSRLYPDSMEEAWAVSYGLASPAQADTITAHLLAAQPEWDQPQSPGLVSGTTQPAGYWPVAGWTFDNAGEPAVASAAAGTIQAAADRVGRAWPFTPAAAGSLIILATGGPLAAGITG